MYPWGEDSDDEEKKEEEEEPNNPSSTRARVLQKLQTARPELFDDVNGDFFGNKMVVQDVLAIVCDGKRYQPRGGTEEYRIPEDMSTGIAKACFGVNAYQ